MTNMKGFSTNANQYKRIFGRANEAHRTLKKHKHRMFKSGQSKSTSLAEIERAHDDCHQWLETYTSFKARFERRSEERAERFLSLNETEPQSQAGEFVAAFGEEREVLEQIWQAAICRVESLLALLTLLECQQEMLRLARKRHSELVADCPVEQREKEIAFGSFFPMVRTRAANSDDPNELLTLREISPSPINIVLLTNENNLAWRNERAQWVQEILVGWGFSSGTWPYRHRFPVEEWGTELWNLFITDDFKWPLLDFSRSQNCNADEINYQCRKLERVLYSWQRGRALDASRIYRKLRNSDGYQPKTDKAHAKKEASDKREAAVERKTQSAQRKAESAMSNLFIELAVVAQNPEAIISQWEDKEILQQTVFERQGAVQLTEREHLVVRLKSVPDIKIRQIAALLQVDERTISSDLSLLRYHLKRPVGTKTRVRRKRDEDWSAKPKIPKNCDRCQSKQLIKRGRTRNGKQRYGCRACGRTMRCNPASNIYDEARKKEILLAHEQGVSLHGLKRTFGVSRQTVNKWLKDGLEKGEIS